LTNILSRSTVEPETEAIRGILDESAAVNNIFYIIGVVVVVLVILSFLGLR
jgi:hypothetical protein